MRGALVPPGKHRLIRVFVRAAVGSVLGLLGSLLPAAVSAWLGGLEVYCIFRPVHPVLAAGVGFDHLPQATNREQNEPPRNSGRLKKSRSGPPFEGSRLETGRRSLYLVAGTGESTMFAQTFRTLFEVGTIGGLADGQLLDQFASRQDETAEAAFAALVARHGPMVLCVCRGVLGDAHDAEDAFQATFLVLAKRAGSIRDPNLLGNWLYGVARRTAQKAKGRRARWMGCTEGDASMSLIAGDMARAELRPIQGEESEALHEEVDQLPHRLRVPIVLCYLEGLTHAEAARRLRWPIGTVRSRMARARGLLKSRLARRGLAYAGFVIASETSRAVMAEVPQALAARTARSAVQVAAGAASGLASAPVATLVAEVLKAMITSQLKRTAVTLLAAACLAAGVEMIAATASQAHPSNKQRNAVATQAADQQQAERDRDEAAARPADKARSQKMTVTGTVLDPAGKPVSGAAVAVFGFPRQGRWGGDYAGAHPVLGQTTAARAGRFRMTVPRTSSEAFYTVDVISGAPGFGMGWRPLNPDAESPEVEIRLRPEQAVHGRLVDLRGQPAAGIAVSVEQFATQTDGERDGVGIREPSESLTHCASATVKTDERGPLSHSRRGAGAWRAGRSHPRRAIRRDSQSRIEPAGACVETRRKKSTC